VASTTSVQMLARCKFMARRPASDAEVSDAQWYLLLSQAQEHWYQVFATMFPEVLYGAPTIMETSDNKVFTFASSVFPIGEVEIRASRTGELLVPGPEFDENTDFTPEGSQIRLPSNSTRSFPDGAPYARYITPPSDIDGDNEPTLAPAFARILIVDEALILFSERGGGQRDPAIYRAMKQRHWSGDPAIAGDTGILETLNGQYYGGGSGAAGSAHWWRGPDLG
jgi:hypothetical protein